MGKYRSYQVDEKSHENDDITFDIVAVEEEHPQSLTCRACDGEIEIGFTLRENPTSGESEFKSDGEVTVNFIKLLARLFEKNFEVKNAVDAILFEGFWIQDIVEGDLLDKNGRNNITCTLGTADEESGSEVMEAFGQFFPEIDKINKQDLSAEERSAKKQELLEKFLSVQRKQIEKNNYAEIYVHIDMQNRQLGFSMINSAYQLPILRLLTDTPSVDE